MRDPYDVLGVSRKATDAEIKKAFRSLAKKHHPDTHANDPKAVKKFQEISGAYELLGDKEKRAQFDRGEIDANGQPKGFDQGFRPGGGFGGFEGMRGRAGKAGPQGYEFQWSGGEGVNAEDIFADLFGGGGKRRAQSRKGADIQLQTTVSLQEAANGGVRRVIAGDGRELEVRIPAGVANGKQIRLRGQGAPGERGGPAGDALIEIAIAPHPYFERDGRDLRLDLPISLKEAIEGAKVQVPTLTGPVSVTVPPHSNSGRVLRLKGKGLPTAGADPPGDLYARLIVTLPETPDPNLDAFARSWDYPYDPRARLK
jgi:DnaJ-class molecular chaperone